MEVAHSFEDVEVTIRGSLIKGDVIAKDDSTIVLINTTVKGKLIEEWNGRVANR